MIRLTKFNQNYPLDRAPLIDSESLQSNDYHLQLRDIIR